MGERVRYRVIVSGEVQGVWFRESCRRVASELALGGWVRNCADGTVEALFEGPEPDVAMAVAWCRVGLPAANVTGIDVVAEPPADLCGFSVR